MKKIIFLIIMLICITGCNKNENILDITFSNIEDCNIKPVLLTSSGDINIYTYCIEDIKVNVNNKFIDLKKYINKKDNAINNIMNFLPYKDDLNITYDIYRNESLKLIKCYSDAGNEDVYIGNNKMNFKKNFCKDNNYTFVRTYYVEDIENNYEEGVDINSFKIKLKDFKDNVETVVLNYLYKTIEKNKYYEFEFMLNEGVSKIDDNIESIFNNSTIVEIRKSTKDIKEQINDKLLNN